MTDVFISYSRKDREFVHALHDALVGLGNDTWVDWEDIPLTADWQQEINEAIQAAHTFVFVISPDSVASEVCGLELGHAIRFNKRLIPIYHRDVDLHMVNPALRAYNFVYLRQQDDFDSTIRALNVALNTDLEYVKYHARLMVRAIEWDSKKRDDSYALRGGDLREAERWLASSAGKNPDPGELHLQYIAASRQAAIARQRVTVGSLVVGIVVAIALAALAFYQFQVATEEAHSRATAQAVAVTQQNAAEQNAATALAAESTAQRSADEAQSQALAAAAQLALNENNTELAVALGLDANTVPDPPPGAQRALAEAAYTPAVRRAFVGHSHGQTLADISPDGRTMVSAGIDGEVFVWDAISGQIVRRLQGAVASIVTLDLSPDGHLAVTGSCKSADADTFACSSELILWDVDAGTLIRRWTSHAGVTQSAVFSPDGKWIASGGYDNQAVIWDVETGVELQRFTGSYGNMKAVAFTVNGDSLLGGASGGIDMWDVKTGKLVRSFGRFLDGVWTIVTSPDGARMVAGTRTGRIVMWDLNDATEIRQFVGHVEEVNSITFTPDGTQMISASGGGVGLDSSIILWDVETGALLRRFEAPIADSDTQAAQIGIRTVRFTPDGDMLSASDDGVLRLWDMENGAIIRRFSGHRLQIEIGAIAYSADGAYLATGSAKLDVSNSLAKGDGEIYLWDVGTSQPIREFKGHTGSVTGLAFLSDGQRLLSSSEDGTLIVWDIASGNMLQQVKAGGNPISQMVLSADGGTAITRADDGQVMVWDLATMEARTGLQEQVNGVLVLAITADGGRTATFGVDEEGPISLSVRDTQTGTLLWSVDAQGLSITALAFSPDGRYLLSGHFDGSLLLWDAASGERIGQPFVGHEGNRVQRINSIAFSPDGQYALSGSSDSTMILWAFPEGQALRRFREGTDWVVGVAFSPDGHRAAAGLGSKLVLWRIDTLNELIAWTYANRVVREPNCNERIQYRLQPVCDEQGDFPTHTPYPSLTPSATFTPSPTLDLTRITVTPTLTPTATATATATLTPTVTLTPTPTTGPSTPIPFADVERLTAELNLPFKPLLPGSLPNGVYVYSVKSRIPVEADAPLVTGDMAFLIGLSTDPTYSPDHADKVVAVIQTTTTFQTVKEWADSTTFGPIMSYITFTGYDVAYLREDATSGTLVVLHDGLLIRFLYLGLDLNTVGAVMQSFLPPR